MHKAAAALVVLLGAVGVRSEVTRRLQGRSFACSADFNVDGVVGVDDLLVLLANYGRETGDCGSSGAGGRYQPSDFNLPGKFAHVNNSLETDPRCVQRLPASKTACSRQSSHAHSVAPEAGWTHGFSMRSGRLGRRACQWTWALLSIHPEKSFKVGRKQSSLGFRWRTAWFSTESTGPPIQLMVWCERKRPSPATAATRQAVESIRSTTASHCSFTSQLLMILRLAIDSHVSSPFTAVG